MPTRNVDLTEHFDSFIAEGVESGRFSDASDAVRAGLHLLERQQAQDRDQDTAAIEALRCAAQEGIDAIERGDAVTLRSREEITTFVRSAGSARR